MRFFILLFILLEMMQQNEIMADHRMINRSDFRGNFFRRRNYDGPRAFQIGPDLPCSYDNQCSGYPLAICDSVCKCVKGSLNTGTTCIASSTALQSSVACPTGQTYIREAGVCMTVQQPGEPCQYSQQCSALEPGAYCLKMRCECVYGMKKSSNGCTFVNNDCKERGHIFISEIGECREVIPPGGKGCSHNLQCSGAYPDATCFMQTCTCPPNLPVAADGTCGRLCPDQQVYSGVTGECLPEKQPGQDCIYSSQCQAAFGGLVCDKNTCRCPNGLVFDGLKCSQSCPPNKRVIDKEICVEGCSNGLVEVSGRCVKQVSIGQPCTGNAQCNFGSFCQSGTCQCPPGFYVVDSQCQAIESDPNGSCQNNEKCTKGSVCYNGKCICPRNQELINGQCQPNRAAVTAYNTALNNIRRIRLRFASQSKSRNLPNNSIQAQLTDTDNNDTIVPIGSACVRVGVTCDGGSVCVAGICVCPLRKTPRNGICIDQVAARPGASCANGEECVENSICSEETNMCECVKPSQMVVGGQCVERLRSHPGYGCSMGELCVGNSVCVNGRCECTNGKVDINKICVDPVAAKLGDTCGKGIICQGGSYCNLDSGKCACPRGEKEIHGECKAVTLAHPGDLCTDLTSRCTGGSYCVRGRCECPFSMHAVDKKCVLQQTAAPGEPCTESISCSGLSVCKNNRCTCVNEMIVRDKLCVQRRKVNIGSTCDPDDQCLGNSTCVDNSCECPTGHVASLNVCVLRKTVTPGYLCNPEDICTGQSVCIKGVCQCKEDYKQMHNICVKKSIGLEGSPCSSRDDCGEGLTCDSGKCACPEGLFSVNGRCRSYIQLGQTCTSDDRCAVRNANCRENICSCNSGFVNINGQCVVAQIVTPAEPEVLSQVKSGLIGHICTTNDHCKIQHSHCRRNVCICKDGYRIFGSTQCIPRVAKPKEKKLEKTSKLVELGEQCDRLSLCQRGAICENGVCSCPETFYESDGVCVKNIAKIKVIVPPLSACLNGEECSGNSECVHGMCFCKEDYTLYQGKCQRLKMVEKLRILETTKKIGSSNKIPSTSTATPGQKKATTTSTTTPATTTRNLIRPNPKTNTLPPLRTTTLSPLTPIKISMKLGSTDPDSKSQTTPNPNYEYKWKLSKPGRPCDSLSFCTSCSVCVNGFCRCPEGLELYGEECVSQIDATKCMASNQCPSGAQCIKGECKCKPGLAISRYGFCVPITFAEPGTSCAEGERCQRDSHCEDGLCVCNEPLVLKDNKCVRSPREKRFVADLPRKLLRFTPKKPAKLGEYCFRDNHCESQRQCLKNVCKCARNFVQSSFSCVPRMSVISTLALPGESCRKGFCVGGSICSNFICKCPEDYFKQGDSCVRYESRIGAPCGMTTGCSGGSQCSSSFCQCMDQYDADEDECYPQEMPMKKGMRGISGRGSGRRKVNRVVSASAVNCPIGYDLVNGMCVNSETLSVIQLSEPGGACEDGTVLCTGNSVCANNICICPGGETVQNGTCIAINTYSAPGELCDLVNTICTGNSQCVDSVCKCPSNQGAINGRCANMGNMACGQSQCGNNQVCIQDICQCRPGYYQPPNSCVADRCNCVQEIDMGTIDGCNTRQCGVNQMCIQDRCQCRTGYLQLPETCVNDRCNCVQPSVDVGGCVNQCGTNQICIQDQCQCKNGYYVQPDSCVGDRCNCVTQQIFPDAVVGCNRQCGNNQVCVQDQCQCRTGYYAQSETCIGDRCNCIQRSSVSAPCVGNGCSVISSSGVQSFSPFFGLPGQMCDLRPDATPCRNQAQCINNYCSCPSDRVISGSDCIRYLGDALPGQSCQNSGMICRGGSSCNQNVCQCATGFQPTSGRCTPIIEVRFTMIPITTAIPAIIIELNPGQTCDPNCSFQPCLQRCSGGSSCNNAICSCPQGSFSFNNVCTPNFSQNDNTNFTRTARPGDSCDNSIVCIGGSSCLIGTCSCDTGYTPSSDRTSCVLIDRYNVRSRSYPKTFCTFDSECTGGAICVDKRCACRNDHEMVNGNCQLANQPGSRCHTSFCSKGSECRNGYCVCAKTNTSNAALDCVPASGSISLSAYPGSKCEKSTVCLNDTSCIFGFCVIPQDETDKEMNIVKQHENHSKKQLVRRIPQQSVTECPRDGSCRLPNCFCTSSGKVPPNNLDPKQVPQMVMLSFDDPITDRIINTLKSLFSGKIRNPNGCAIKGTFFISHQWNNYDQTLWLHSKGHEIGVNSITREDISGRTKERWHKEQKKMRDTLAEFSYVDRSQIIGTKAPNYKIGGDAQFGMMAENNFTYDNSMFVNGAYWPQTLDHKLSWECDGRCPINGHRGVWQIPVQNVQADDTRWYKTMTRALKPIDSRDSVKKMLMRNFMNHYKTNRAPFVVTLDTEFLTYLPDNGAIHALEDFLKDVVQKQDVFVVTGSQIIDWMQNPVDLNGLKSLRSWQCKFLLNDHVQPCEVPSICSFDGRARGQLAHSFRMCGVCPTSYPWI